jgi:hypothetical protein
MFAIMKSYTIIWRVVKPLIRRPYSDVDVSKKAKLKKQEAPAGGGRVLLA